jgi:hypothetical protein
LKDEVSLQTTSVTWHIGRDPTVVQHGSWYNRRFKWWPKAQLMASDWSLSALFEMAVGTLTPAISNDI